MFKLLSVPVWTALIFHVATVFGPVRVPVIIAVLVLISVSIVSSFHETKTASAEGRNKRVCLVCVAIRCQTAVIN